MMSVYVSSKYCRDKQIMLNVIVYNKEDRNNPSTTTFYMAECFPLVKHYFMYYNSPKGMSIQAIEIIENRILGINNE